MTAALESYPAVNAMIDGKEMVMHDYADIGIAVSSPKGLMVPVVRNAESMSSTTSKLRSSAWPSAPATADHGRRDDRYLHHHQRRCLRLYAVHAHHQLPQSAILGMHNIVERPVAVNGQVEIRPIMYVALSYDHRIIDGKESVSFLVAVKEMLENPERMLFGSKDLMKSSRP